MAQDVLRIGELPAAPLDAASDFHRHWLPLAREASRTSDLVLVFPPADHEHRGWRLAAVQGLAREAAPGRVNAVAGRDPDAIERTIAWLAETPGITGQILPVDGKAAEID